MVVVDSAKKLPVGFHCSNGVSFFTFFKCSFYYDKYHCCGYFWCFCKLKVPIVSITLSQLLQLVRVGAHLRLQGPEPAVSCRHSSVMWALGHTSPTCCHYLPCILSGTKLYCLVTEAHVCEQLAQSRYLTVERLGIEPVTFQTLVRHRNHYTTKILCQMP